MRGPVKRRESGEREERTGPTLLAPPSIWLTPAETAVLIAFTRCDSNREIAAALGMAETTVKTHVRSLFAKLGVHSRAHSVGRALRLGLVTAGQFGGAPAGDLLPAEDMQLEPAPVS